MQALFLHGSGSAVPKREGAGLPQEQDPLLQRYGDAGFFARRLVALQWLTRRGLISLLRREA